VCSSVLVPVLSVISSDSIHRPQGVSRHGYSVAIVAPGSLWRVMRSNGPKSAAKPSLPQLEFDLGS